MEKTKALSLLGINRNKPQGTDDGACDEMINLRPKDGAWRPLGAKEVLYDNNIYELMRIHNQDNINNWIGYDLATKKVDYFNPSDQVVTQAVITLTAEETLNDILFIKRYMLVVTDKNLYKFLFKDTTYILITLTEIGALNSRIANLFNVALARTDLETTVETELADNAAGLLGKYFKKLNELSDDGKFIGGVFYRTALKMFDGSYTLHSTPTFYQFTNYGGQLVNVAGQYKIVFNNAASVLGTSTYSELLDPGSLDILKNIVDSYELYFSQNQQFFDISESTITDDLLAAEVPNPGDSVELDTILDIDEDFKDKMYDSNAWYKVGASQLSAFEPGIPAFILTTPVDMDLEGFYKNYATRKVLPIDNFSHHDLTGNAAYIYNDRLNLGNTLQTLTDPIIKAMNPLLFPVAPIIGAEQYTVATTATLRMQVILDTTDGEKVVQQALTVVRYSKNSNPTKEFAIFMSNVLSYPDARAKEIVINVDVGGTYYEIYRSNMTKSELHNFSYAYNDSFLVTDDLGYPTSPRKMDTNFNSIPITWDTDDLTAEDPKDISKEILDNNRWAISEVANPFVFPSENSNQVGTGTIIAFGTNTEKIGVSQFGQYPIIIFTSVGRWIAEIGTGEIYITRIVPLDGDVLRDKDAKLDLAFGVAYITAEGLKIASGKEVMEISEPVEGLQDQSLIDNDNFKHFTNLVQTVQLVDYADKIRFETYLIGASIGYSKGSEHNEIIVANSSYLYAYVYDLNAKIWYKITDKYSTFINSYPNLFARRTVRAGTGPAYSETTKIVNFTNEVAGNTQVMIITRAFSLGGPDVFKKLRRTFVRSFMNTTTDKYAAAYVFSSDDLKTWNYVTGNDRNTGSIKDIWITHSFHSARFYILVFIADLNVDRDAILNRVNQIDIQFDFKRNHKLR